MYRLCAYVTAGDKLSPDCWSHCAFCRQAIVRWCMGLWHAVLTCSVCCFRLPLPTMHNTCSILWGGDSRVKSLVLSVGCSLYERSLSLGNPRRRGKGYPPESFDGLARRLSRDPGSLYTNGMSTSPDTMGLMVCKANRRRSIEAITEFPARVKQSELWQTKAQFFSSNKDMAT